MYYPVNRNINYIANCNIYYLVNVGARLAGRRHARACARACDRACATPADGQATQSASGDGASAPLSLYAICATRSSSIYNGFAMACPLDVYRRTKHCATHQRVWHGGFCPARRGGLLVERLAPWPPELGRPLLLVAAAPSTRFEGAAGQEGDCPPLEREQLALCSRT